MDCGYLNALFFANNWSIAYGAVHILRKPLKGGVSQMLTIADEGGGVKEKFDKMG